MYLTRFRINTARSGARRLLGSPNFMHGAVNMAFPDPPPRDGTGPRVLWRVDPAPAGRADLFIVSPDRPDLTHLVEEAGWPGLAEPGWTTFAYDEFLGTLTEGSTWGFRLTANPVHNIRRDVDSRDSPTKRAAHITPRHQIGWLLKRQENAGFEVIESPAERRLTEHGHQHEVIVHDRMPLQFTKAGTANGRPQVRFTRVTFDGRLRVTDADTFRRTLTNGLGKAKAYGCGLMTLAPLS
ncbi:MULTISPECIES: type I-E CRISPR-associated protein Cas6/Cse3/CasE [unclassified Streptomyces]|uniref:type I-E CRISPR-associated protein Cas6/Cse3/CasE n=1 Tax=unclassified Streptomyces TaxID=2593676 RepID=UPI000DD89662|nr:MULTISPECIES: type I-E CRISPR-associated protein Cas6/Cse3/CasE [unclassified Streptomyces]QZZ28936.1 type I-E CRISPR-associated protein Cas6/Cse3/CasE [Streptomyces sp. ST1015]